jgi:hypothetical protein
MAWLITRRILSDIGALGLCAGYRAPLQRPCRWNRSSPQLVPTPLPLYLLANTKELLQVSVDPMTGRNPSYCFIDFATKNLAERVILEYHVQDFMRRKLKVNAAAQSRNNQLR